MQCTSLSNKLPVGVTSFWGGFLFIALVLFTLHSKAAHYGLIMTIGHYSDPTANLPGIELDAINATAIAKSLGIPKSNIQFLSDSKLTAAGFKKAFNDLTQKITKGDSVFVYYSGHGTQSDAGSGKCSEGMVAYDMAEYKDADIQQNLAQLSSKASRVIMMNDSCFSGGQAQSNFSRSINGSPIHAKAFKLSKVSAGHACGDPINMKILRNIAPKAKAAGSNLLYIAAAQDNEVANASAEGSYATLAWKQCISEKSDTDHSGALSGQEIKTCAQRYIDSQHINQHVALVGNKDLPLVFVGEATNQELPSIATNNTPPANQPRMPAVTTKPPTTVPTSATQTVSNTTTIQNIPSVVTNTAPPANQPRMPAVTTNPPTTVPTSTPSTVSSVTTLQNSASVVADNAPLVNRPRMPAVTTKPPTTAPTSAAPTVSNTTTLQNVPTVVADNAPPANQPRMPAVTTNPPTTVPTSTPLTVSSVTAFQDPPTVVPDNAQPENHSSVPDLITNPPATIETSSTSPVSNTTTFSAANALNDLHHAASPAFLVKINLANEKLKINIDPLNFSVSTNKNGYLTILQVGSDGKTFNRLFPNDNDQNNFIKTGTTVLPRPSWQIKAGGPSGNSYLLAIVSEAPRDFSTGMKNLGPFRTGSGAQQAKNLYATAIESQQSGQGSYGASEVIKIEEY